MEGGCVSDPNSPDAGKCRYRCTTVTIGSPIPPNAIRKKAIIVPANEDDDDNNNVRDSEQADPAPAGEDDLKAVPVTCGTQGTLQLSCSGCGRVRLWKNANRTEPLDLGCWSSCEPNCQPLANRPAIIYVEGVAASDGDGDVVLSAKFVKRDAACVFECICTDTAPLTVVSLREGSLTWERNDDFPGNPDLGNCDNNGGKKIFPDLIDQTDGANAAKRRTVDLVATIKPKVKGATVYFKVWDVDDPFDQLNPSMPVLGLIDSTPTSGPDNRPPPGEQPWTATAVTGANGQPSGKARVTFTVSMQPGNNYRAGGSVNSDAPSQADQPKADAADDEFVGKPGDFAEYKVPLTWSPMLTVWRKLHVETDTMVRPTFTQNTFTMPWNEPRQGTGSSYVLFDVDDPFSNPFQTNNGQFTNGYVEILRADGTRLLVAKVLDYTNSAAGDDVTLIAPDCGNGQIGINCFTGVTPGDAIFSDDDLSDPVLFSAKVWGCDDTYTGGANTSALSPPDLGALQSQYRPAYIDPSHDQTINTTGGVSIFLRNINFDESPYGKDLWDQAKAPGVRNLPISTTNYWTVMVISAWQAEENDDADADIEAQSYGITLGINTHSDGSTTNNFRLNASYIGLCTIFKAVTQPGAESTDLGAEAERMRVSHEIGHTLGLSHEDGGHMCTVGECQKDPFAAISLKKLREYNGP